MCPGGQLTSRTRVDESKSCLRGGHRRGQLRDNRADVPREVLKVAALSAALTIERPGAALLAQPFPQRHDLSSVT